MSSATGPESERATDDEPGYRFVAPAVRPTAASRRATLAASLAGVPRRLDRAAALMLIATDEYPIDHSFFEGVAVVAPRMRISSRVDGTLLIAESTAPPARALTEAEAALGLRQSLDSGVGRALAGGARVAVALSGGLDSSVIAVSAHAASRRLGRPTDTLVLYHMLPRAGASEVEHARSIAKSLDRPLLEFPAPEGDPFESVVPLAAASDFPFDGPGAHIGLAAFRRLAAEGVDLVLTGDGGDEAVGRVGQAEATGFRALVRPVYLAFAPRWLRERRRGLPGWLSSRLRDLDPMTSSPPQRAGLVGPFGERDRALRSSRQCAVVGWYRTLERVTGVRTAVPFLDPAVVDLVVSLPQGLLAAGGRPKGLLRRAYVDELPVAERERPKDQPDVEPIVRDDFRRHGDLWAEQFLRSGTLERLELMPRAVAAGVIVAAREGSDRDLYRALSLIWISIWADANGL